MSFLKGETLTFAGEEGVKTVTWKQGSMLGFGGDRSQNYYQCKYKMSGGNPILVFVQAGWNKPEKLKVDGNVQYGLNDGIIFLVLHDKENKPYQHRFVINNKEAWLKWAHDLQKAKTGVDVSWIAGDYLHTF